MHDLRRGPVSFSWLVRATLLVGLLLGLLWLGWQMTYMLLLFFGAVVIASILISAGDLVARLTPLSGKWALIVAGVIIAALATGFIYLLGTRIAAEFSTLSETLPAALDAVAGPLGIDWEEHLASIRASRWTNGLIGMLPDLISAVTGVILIIFGGVFMALSPATYREGLLKLVPEEQRDEARRTVLIAGRALRLWLIGQLIAMAIVGVAVTTMLFLVGVPSALALGVTAGILEFVPFLGPLVALVPAALVALSDSTSTFIWTLVGYTIIQQVEGNLLIPIVQKHTVELPPVLTLFAMVGLGLLFGPLGLVFSVPLTLVLLIMVKRLYLRDALGEDTDIPGQRE
ncbi:AI-2E family transporter [Devosia sp. RR2S18]|uniref:AI-2E family transporter n=1 Tax=Devosia rhizosphaerae TaxID=3049774 RepID=UPI0025417F79|nr:AI-2E family transporter [Devosia sp. RR2S18]WIJ24972.1 AI-2E family transporter [Devosia sp. RR2S18]